jgi:hypothetical protein
LSLHSAWPKTDPFLAAVVKSWQVMARALGSVADTVIQGIFPWCFTPEMYAEKPEFVAGLEDFVRGRPPRPSTPSSTSPKPSSLMTPRPNSDASSPPHKSPTGAGTS